ncbi:hypothetical protein TWF696_006486 [Orbilia brochopaga]|uniref:Uncharacterized protein n=1 Tax=Orbilia brochopaga TaxID=3140254 RepID=A0AAV9UWG4_9PEZI
MCWVFQWFQPCHHLALTELSEIDMRKAECKCDRVLNSKRIQKLDFVCELCELVEEGKMTTEERTKELEKMQRLILERGPILKNIQIN